MTSTTLRLNSYFFKGRAHTFYYREAAAPWLLPIRFMQGNQQPEENEKRSISNSSSKASGCHERTDTSFPWIGRLPVTTEDGEMRVLCKGHWSIHIHMTSIFSFHCWSAAKKIAPGVLQRI
jgi:hypothetical protein